MRLIGFWWDKWSKKLGERGRDEVMSAVYGMMRDGTVKLPIESTYSFEQFAEALKHDKQPRLGKVLLKP